MGRESPDTHKMKGDLDGSPPRQGGALGGAGGVDDNNANDGDEVMNITEVPYKGCFRYNIQDAAAMTQRLVSEIDKN